MLLQVAARSGHDQPESMASTVQDIAGIQQVAQSLVGLDAPEEQESTRFESGNVLVDMSSAEYAVGNHVDSPGDAAGQLFEFGPYSRPMHDHAACLPAEPLNDLPSAAVLGKHSGVGQVVLQRQHHPKES